MRIVRLTLDISTDKWMDSKRSFFLVRVSDQLVSTYPIPESTGLATSLMVESLLLLSVFFFFFLSKEELFVPQNTGFLFEDVWGLVQSFRAISINEQFRI